MIPLIVLALYMVVVLSISAFAFRKGKSTGEDFFLASRSIGGIVFFLSLFATNMTAFAILGSSGKAYNEGIGVYGLMASSSGLVIPLCLFFIGTRLWAHGRRFGHMTQVQFFRDRFECSTIGTVIFALTATMLVPYIIISIIAGGKILEGLSAYTAADGAIHHYVSYPLGAGLVAAVVLGNVFFGGMRGAVLVNVFQTILFFSFGLVAVATIGANIEGGFPAVVQRMADAHSALLTREKMPPAMFWSYTLIPLSAIMFPHMSIMCLTARKITAFKKTVMLYPVSIMAIWLPCVFLGVVGSQFIHYKTPQESDRILMDMLHTYAPAWLAGVLGAGIMSAVMGSDCHQILALSTMFTKDVFDYYGGRKRFGEKSTVFVGRAFILLVNVVAYLIALARPEGIFDLAITYAFSGFAALAPIMLGALFWRRSTKHGALAATLFVAASIVAVAVLENSYARGATILQFADTRAVFLTPAGKLSLFGCMPVVAMVLGSAVSMVVGSLLTRPPSQATINRYFETSAVGAVLTAAEPAVAMAHAR